MKTRLLIIIGIIIVVTISISLAYDQEIKLILEMQTDVESSDQYSERIEPESQNQGKNALNNLKCSSNGIGGIRCMP